MRATTIIRVTMEYVALHTQMHIDLTFNPVKKYE